MGLWDKLLGGVAGYPGVGIEPGHPEESSPRPLRWFRRRLAARPSPRQRGCRACGACCELFGGHLRASRADQERWRTQGRDDLLGRVNRLGWIWIDPDTGSSLSRCPFLERASEGSARCQIHDTKPEMCRAYPTLAHGRQCVRGVLVH